MRAVKCEINGVEYHLVFNGHAFLRAKELWPEDSNVMDLLDPQRPDALENLCELLVMMSEFGELARRHYGYDPGPMLDAHELEALPIEGTPGEIIQLHGLAKLAIMKGFAREVEPLTQKEVDLGLVELEKQKKTETD